MWQPKGKKGTIMMKSNTGRRRINILGSLNINDHSIIATQTEESCNATSVIEFFQRIKNVYPDKKIVILLDNARYNRANATRDFVEENGIELLFLPPYSPNLNLIERLWKFSKKKLVNNKYHETFSQFKNTTERFFENIGKYLPELVSIFTQKFQIIHAD